MGTLRHARLRRIYAVTLGVLWLLGIEVLPNVHLATHDHGKPHQHTASGMVVTVSFDRDSVHYDRDSAPHRHDDGSVHAHAPKPKAKSPIGVLAFGVVPDLHVAGGLAHHAVALHAAPAPMVDAIAVDRVATDIILTTTGREALAFAGTASARGPPHVIV